MDSLYTAFAMVGATYGSKNFYKMQSWVKPETRTIFQTSRQVTGRITRAMGRI